jgi:carboxymethylenebutenolidase
LKVFTQSMRLASGHEALVTRVEAADGRIALGFSLHLDAAQSRHMAMHQLGLWPERPKIEPAMAHPWETAWIAAQKIPWDAEPAFATLEWTLPGGTMGKNISYKRPDGQSVNGYLAEPAQAASAPGIVVIQEWWGLNDQIRGVADKLANAGYRALVPDLYRGKVALDANEANHLMTGLNFGDAAGQDIRGAVQYLKASGSPKAGVTGFCMGGALTVLSAVNVPEMDAGVIWYGYPPLEYVDASKIKAPLMGHWATHDQAFAISGVDELEKKLKAANVKYDFYRYDAKHAFANETADSKNLAMLKYDPQAAETAWKRTMDFFAKALK